MATLDLTDKDGMRQVWFVDQNGELFGGAEAVNRAMRQMWWAKPFTYFYYLPLIRQIQDKAYRWVANNRGFMAKIAHPFLPTLPDQEN